MSETSVTTQIGPSDADLDAWLKSLAQPSPATDDKGRIDRIARLERLKGAVSAAQARETVEFKASQLAEQKAAGMKSGDLGKGLSAEVALARRESPTRGSRLASILGNAPLADLGSSGALDR
jgi:hypothetical protein